MKKSYLAVAVLASTLLLASCSGGGETHIVIDTQTSVYEPTSNGLVFERDLDGEGFSVQRYVGESNRVIIPETFEGKPVKSIQRRAFANNGLEYLRIPNKVASIGEFAFIGNPKLNNIEVQGGDYFRIQDGALISKDEKTLAFVYPNKVGQYNIGKNVTKVVKGAFESTSLTILKFDPTLIEDNFMTFFGPSASAVPENMKEVILTADFGDVKRDGVVGDFAFAGLSSITSVAMYDSIVEIGEKAFYSMSNLKTVVIPDTVLSIGEKAFASCSKLRDVRIGLTGSPSLEKLGDGAFEGDGKLVYNTTEGIKYLGNPEYPYLILMEPISPAIQKVQIDDTTLFIASDAFKNCAAINKVTSSAELLSIGKNAFSGTLNLTSFSLPSSLEYLGNGAFTGSGVISDLEFDNGGKYLGSSKTGFYALVDVNPTAEKLTIKSSTKFIDYSKVNQTVSNIKSFTNNSEYFSIPESSGNVILTDADETQVILTAKKGDFDGFMLDDGIVEIKDYAFSGLDIEDFELPTTVERIGDGAFSGFKFNAGSVIELPESLDVIGNNAFDSALNVSKMILNDGLRSIGASAFKNLSALSALYIPLSVTEIGAAIAEGTAVASIDAEIEADLENPVLPGSWSSSWCAPLTLENINFGAER